MINVSDEIAKITINDLMTHYKTYDYDELIKKAITALKISTYIDMTHGELIARKNGQETKILI